MAGSQGEGKSKKYMRKIVWERIIGLLENKVDHFTIHIAEMLESLKTFEEINDLSGIIIKESKSENVHGKEAKGRNKSHASFNINI